MKIDSFFIKQQKESINYKLILFSNIKIHSIFHLSLLKLADSKTFIQNIFHFQYEEKDKYKIEKMLKQTINNTSSNEKIVLFRNTHKNRLKISKIVKIFLENFVDDKLIESKQRFEKKNFQCKKIIHKKRGFDDALNFVDFFKFFQTFEFFNNRQIFVEQFLLTIFQKFFLFSQTTKFCSRNTNFFDNNVENCFRFQFFVFNFFMTRPIVKKSKKAISIVSHFVVANTHAKHFKNKNKNL